MEKTLWLIILLLLINPIYGHAEVEQAVNNYTEKAIVLEVEAGEVEEHFEGMITEIQNVKLKLISGENKGEIFHTENHLSDSVSHDIIVEEGDKVVVAIDELEDGSLEVHIADYLRENQIYYLLGLFILLIILVGGKKGVKAVLTLAITLFLILGVLLPLMLKGVNPIPISVAISIIITIITLSLIGGVNNKSLSAIIGTSSGVLIAGIIAYFVGSQVMLTGLSGDEATMLMYIPQGIEFNFRSLLFSGIILGSLGAIMDVGMSVASSIEEVDRANTELKARALFSSGMNVGKDIMGTMTNTLILAYTGSSIPLLLLFMAYETSMVKVINLDIIATEIVRALSGSIGLVLTIPITALVSTILIKRRKRDRFVK